MALSELAVEANYIESMVSPKEVNHAPRGFYRVTRSDQTTHARAEEATVSALDEGRPGIMTPPQIHSCKKQQKLT